MGSSGLSGTARCQIDHLRLRLRLLLRSERRLGYISVGLSHNVLRNLWIPGAIINHAQGMAPGLDAGRRKRYHLRFMVVCVAQALDFQDNT